MFNVWNKSLFIRIQLSIFLENLYIHIPTTDIVPDDSSVKYTLHCLQTWSLVHILAALFRVFAEHDVLLNHDEVEAENKEDFYVGNYECSRLSVHEWNLKSFNF